MSGIGIRLDVYHHFDLPARVEQQIADILDVVRAIQAQEATVTPELQRLQQSVSDETSIVSSAVTLISGLADQIRALKDDPAALAALADQVDAAKQQLADAVANTPAPA